MEPAANRSQFEVGALTETGYERQENQDRMGAARIPLGHLYIVADGMGGHAGGARAARLVVDELQSHLTGVKHEARVEQAITEAFQRANDTVYGEASSRDPKKHGMGSTAVLLLAVDREAYIAHVGDSRAYLFRGGKLRQLTKDHTQVQKMIDAGILTEEEGRDHPDASQLSKAIGNEPTVTPDINKLRLKEGDEILLCSDGLCGYADDSEIENILREGASVQRVPPLLVELALSKGGEDNITVQYIHYGGRKEKRKEKLEKQPQSGSKRPRPALYAIGLLGVAGIAIALSVQWYLDQQWHIKNQLAEKDQQIKLLKHILTKTVDPQLAEKDQQFEQLTTASEERERDLNSLLEEFGPGDGSPQSGDLLQGLKGLLESKDRQIALLSSDTTTRLRNLRDQLQKVTMKLDEANNKLTPFQKVPGDRSWNLEEIKRTVEEFEKGIDNRDELIRLLEKKIHELVPNEQSDDDDLSDNGFQEKFENVYDDLKTAEDELEDIGKALKDAIEHNDDATKSLGEILNALSEDKT